MTTLRRTLNQTRAWGRALGLWPRFSAKMPRDALQTFADFTRFKAARRGEEASIPLALDYPCLLDRHDAAGRASGHYFHQDLLVARRIFEQQPRWHIDVGSRIDGFVAHVACFREIEVIDIRPPSAAIPNVTFRQMDITNPDHCRLGAADSVSCLHALEHFGLGRFGDPIDPLGYQKGLDGLVNLLEPGGVLYLSVPIGRERIEFNAHRVFSMRRLLQLLKHLELCRFSYVDDLGALHSVQDAEQLPLDTLDSLHFGLGIFELKKPNRPSKT